MDDALGSVLMGFFCRWIEIKPALLSRLGWFRNTAKIHFTAVDDQEDMATLNILQQVASEAGKIYNSIYISFDC